MQVSVVHGLSSDISDWIHAYSHQNFEACYQCHKCAAGCPVINEMQFGPDRILKMISMGRSEEIMRSRDIWLCTGCFTCVTRCPNCIDISAVMDALRQASIKREIPPGERDAYLFHRLFMGVVERFGRSHEAFLLGLFKLLSRTPFLNDMGAGLGLLLRGKVPLLPDRFPGMKEVRGLFRRRK